MAEINNRAVSKTARLRILIRTEAIEQFSIRLPLPFLCQRPSGFPAQIREEGIRRGAGLNPGDICFPAIREELPVDDAAADNPDIFFGQVADGFEDFCQRVTDLYTLRAPVLPGSQHQMAAFGQVAAAGEGFKEGAFVNEIKCPQCGTVFKVDETGFADIVRQVRDVEFSRAVEERMALAEAEKRQAVD